MAGVHSPRVRPLLLTVQSGPDKGRQISLAAEPLTIGRGAGEGLQLSDGAVSRHHLTVQAEAGGLRVLEIPGVNPVWTLEAGQRVALKVGHVLAPGAALTVGNSTLVIAASRPATEVTSPPQVSARAVELDATGVLTPTPEVSRLAALAAQRLRGRALERERSWRRCF